MANSYDRAARFAHGIALAHDVAVIILTPCDDGCDARPSETVEPPQADATRHVERVVIDLSGYTLEPLHDDGELILYRGVAASALSRSLLVLVVAPARAFPSPAALARIEHEYSLAAELDPRWAVRPFALARRQSRTALVLDDPVASRSLS